LKITPLEIRKHEFKRSFRGFDPIEVETFLEMIADIYENLLNEKNKLTEERIRLDTELANYQKVEKTLQETLLNLQENKTQSRENSKREADLITNEAKVEAEKLIEKARREVSSLKEEIMVLKTQKYSFATRLKYLLHSQIELIKVLELDDDMIKEIKLKKHREENITEGMNTEKTFKTKETESAPDVKSNIKETVKKEIKDIIVNEPLKENVADNTPKEKEEPKGPKTELEVEDDGKSKPILDDVLNNDIEIEDIIDKL